MAIFFIWKILGSGFWVLGSGFWVLGSGFWVLGSGFWVLGSGQYKVKVATYVNLKYISDPVNNITTQPVIPELSYRKSYHLKLKPNFKTRSPIKYFTDDIWKILVCCPIKFYYAKDSI